MSAVADHINPSTGQWHHAERSNLGAFIGALCFFAGARVLLGAVRRGQQRRTGPSDGAGPATR